MADPIEARMNFIIEQQAQFAADIQQLRERQAETRTLIEANARHIGANTGMIRRLVDVSLSLVHQGEETDRRIRELAVSGEHTDRRLDALIDAVDKLSRGNGS
jgi:hypothetical protein